MFTPRESFSLGTGESAMTPSNALLQQVSTLLHPSSFELLLAGLSSSQGYNNNNAEMTSPMLESRRTSSGYESSNSKRSSRSFSISSIMGWAESNSGEKNSSGGGGRARTASTSAAMPFGSSPSGLPSNLLGVVQEQEFCADGSSAVAPNIATAERGILLGAALSNLFAGRRASEQPQSTLVFPFNNRPSNYLSGALSAEQHLMILRTAATNAFAQVPQVVRRAVFTDRQRRVLESTFQRSRYISRNERKRLAGQLGLKEHQVKIWFQNRRMKWRTTEQQQQQQPANNNGGKDNPRGTNNDASEVSMTAEQAAMLSSSSTISSVSNDNSLTTNLHQQTVMPSSDDL